MRVQFALVLLALVAISGVSANTGKAVLNTVASSQAPVDDIIDLLNTIESNLQAERADRIAQNQTDEEDCQRDVTNYKAEVDHQREEQVKANEAIADRQARIATNEEAITVREAELESNANHLSTKASERETNAALHAEKVAEHEEAIRCIDDIKNQLVGSTLRGSGGGNANTRVTRTFEAHRTAGGFTDAETNLAAFIEVSVSSQSMQQLLDLSDAQLMKESKSELRATYQSALKALAEAKATGQNDKVTTILNLLDKLRLALEESQEGYETEEAAAVAAHAALEEDIENQRVRLEDEIALLNDEITNWEKEIDTFTQNHDAAVVAEEIAQNLLDEKIGVCWANEDSLYNQFVEFIAKNDQELADFATINEIVVNELNGMSDMLKDRVSHVNEGGIEGDKSDTYESHEAEHVNKLKERESTDNWTDDQAEAGGVREEITYEKADFVDE